MEETAQIKAPVPISVLDLSPIVQGGTAADALRNTLDLARHAEKLGFQRYWLAEHHNMPGIASAATSVVIGHVAAGTKSIRVGSGGIMLPNHSPLVIAEQFGTLESLFPGRIDLGLGRAPGSDMRTARALRRDNIHGADNFPHDVQELQALFAGGPELRVHAVPGDGLKVPIWLLGSSLFSAQLAASLGLPFAFASHFAPGMLQPAIEIYRSQFQPSAALDKPHLMVAMNVFAADTEAEAQRLFTSLQQAFVNLRRGNPGPLPPPVDDMSFRMTLPEKMMVEEALSCSVVGGVDKVKSGVEQFVQQTGADELIVTAQIYDHEARKKSFEILASAWN